MCIRDSFITLKCKIILLQHTKEKNKLESEWNSEKQDLLTRHEEELKSITTSQTNTEDKQKQKILNEVQLIQRM